MSIDADNSYSLDATFHKSVTHIISTSKTMIHLWHVIVILLYCTILTISVIVTLIIFWQLRFCDQPRTIQCNWACIIHDSAFLIDVERQIVDKTCSFTKNTKVDVVNRFFSSHSNKNCERQLNRGHFNSKLVYTSRNNWSPLSTLLHNFRYLHE